MKIWFDMDGTIADLYGVENWLPKLHKNDASPYLDAAPLVNLSHLARLLNKLQRQGYEIGIVSWTARGSSPEYDIKVENAKLEWLGAHLKSVKFDSIEIKQYGFPKSAVMTSSEDILFDDEEKNRVEWNGKAYTEKEIFQILKSL